MATTHEHQQQQDEQTRGLILALTVILLSGLVGQKLLEKLLSVLILFGVPGLVAAPFLVALGSAVEVKPASGGKVAARTMLRGVSARRAMYLAAAARRLKAGGSVEAEQRLFRAHQRAEVKRREAVYQVDQAASKHGPVLGWHAERDERTTPLCRAAHGRNFRVDDPPEIGYPGTAHAGNCRCVPVAPWPDGTMLP